MYIKRSPLGKGNLTFGRQKRRFPFFWLILYMIVLGGAAFVYFRFDQIQPQVLAMVGPEPTPTPSADYYLTLGDEAYWNGKLAEAADYYRQGVALVPDDVEVLTTYARYLTLSEVPANLEEALRVSDYIIELAPNEPYGYAMKSRALDWTGNYDQAVIEALRAVEMDPNYAPAHAYLSEAYTDLRQLDLALEQAELAVQLDPFDVDARRNYAYVLEAYGSYNSAIRQYEQALQIHPELLDLWYGLGRNYRGSGMRATTLIAQEEMFTMAVNTYTQILMRAESDPLPHVELGRTYAIFGEDQSAQREFERAIELVCGSAPEDACPRLTYTELVEANFVYPAELVPDGLYIPAWVRLGEVYHKRRNYENAVAIFEEVLAWGEANDVEIPIDVYIIVASDYYYLDSTPDGQPLCDKAVDYAFYALREYESERMENPGFLDSILRTIVLCRDYAGTPPTVAFEFPDRYEEPDIFIERNP